MTSAVQEKGGHATGLSIAAVPLANLLLLPRSLLILSSSLYLSHLHGITPRLEDRVSTVSRTLEEGADVLGIANADLLGDQAVSAGVESLAGWQGSRGVRTSLTFRHAEKVLKSGAFGALRKP
jgi:alkylated DNA repair protein alkB family protein 6